MADAHSKNHDYHIIDPSPWPLLASVGALVMCLCGVAWMQSMKGASLNLFGISMGGPWIFTIGLLIVLYTMYGWWADTVKESHAGDHTP
ncbi:MAG: cytochrome c oxidase subunit 3, partial [Pseudomonadota bacterium]